MNTRLQNQYSLLEDQNKIKFLREDILLDTTWEKSIWGITLQIELGEKVKDVIGKYHQELNMLEPGNLLFPPRETQHISFNQIIYWGGSYKSGPESTWVRIADEFLIAFRAQNKKFHAFKLDFSKLLVTANGIILCGYDQTDEMERLREALDAVLPVPKETTKRNHIIHTTVARYKNRLNNPHKILEYVDNNTESAEMTVNKLLIKKELIYPSLQTETLAEIELV